MNLGTTNLTKDSFWAPLETAQACNARVVDFASINLGAAFKYVDELARVKSPQEFADVVASQMREQFEAMSEQAEEWSATIQGTSSKDDAATESGFGD